jgi:hypothetical protein
MPSRKRIATSAAALACIYSLTTIPSVAAEPSPRLTAWLGAEIVVRSSGLDDHIPLGGKMTFIFDSADNVVRVCTRPGVSQRTPWRSDWTAPCGVALTFVAGSRYCTLTEVKAGNADVLATCHRLRSREIAMHASTAAAGAAELHDLMVFLLEPTATGKRGVAMLIDSPSRVTHNGVAHGDPP